MGTKIGIRDILAMAPHTIIWDGAVKGFHARRQFSDAVTFAVFTGTRRDFSAGIALGASGSGPLIRRAKKRPASSESVT